MAISSCLLCAILIAYMVLKKDRDGRRKFIMFGCVLLALQSGLRHLSVGPDTYAYSLFFKEYVNADWNSVISALFVDSSEFRDPGFGILVKAFGSIIPDWQCFLIATAVLFFFALGRLLYRYVNTTEGVLLAFTLFTGLFNIMTLSAIRQEITIALSMMVIPWINDRQWIKATTVILIGSLIHVSLLFMFVLYPLILFSEKKLKTLYLIAIGFIPFVALFSKSIVGFMVNYMENDYYACYAEKEGNQGNPIVYASLCTFLVIYQFFNYKYLEGKPKYHYLVPTAIAMTVFFPLIFLDGTMIRIGEYFTLYLMISLPLIFEQVSYKKMAYLASIIVLVFFILSKNENYHFFWENVPVF